jgi:hypothetical protein
MKDYFKEFGISPEYFNQSELEKLYLDKIMKILLSNNLTKSQIDRYYAVCEAYDILSNSLTREKYVELIEKLHECKIDNSMHCDITISEITQNTVSEDCKELYTEVSHYIKIIQTRNEERPIIPVKIINYYKPILSEIPFEGLNLGFIVLGLIFLAIGIYIKNGYVILLSTFMFLIGLYSFFIEMIRDKKQGEFNEYLKSGSISNLELTSKK